MSVDRPAVTSVPRPRPDDIPAVARELTAAVLSWSQHNTTDALSALQRAAEAAAQVGAKPRALELLRAASALAKIVDADDMKKPVSPSEVDEMFEFDEPAQKRPLAGEAPTAPRISPLPPTKIELAKAALKATPPRTPSKAPPLPLSAAPPPFVAPAPPVFAMPPVAVVAPPPAAPAPPPAPPPVIEPAAIAAPAPAPPASAPVMADAPARDVGKDVGQDTVQPPSARAFDHVEALGDVPDDARDALLAGAEQLMVGAGKEIPAPDLLVLMNGQLDVRSAKSTCVIETITASQVRLLRTAGPALGATPSLVIVGGPVGAHGLVLRVDALQALRAAAPWVAEELDTWSDSLHAFAGLFQGKLGSRLNPALLAELRKRVEVRRLRPGTLAVKAAEKVRALVLVGAGELTIHSSAAADGPITARVGIGGVLFAKELAGQLAAPATVRAGANGALLLVAKRNATEEILGDPRLRALVID